MNATHKHLLKVAIEATQAVCSDTTVGQETTLESIEELLEILQPLRDTLLAELREEEDSFPGEEEELS